MSSPLPVASALRAVRPGPIFLGLLAATIAGGVLLWFSGSEFGAMGIAGIWLLVLGGWVISLCLHEFAHAFTAYVYGDRSPEMTGYLTLDPRKYTHPALSIGLPVLIILLGGIGFPGGAVYLHTGHMTSGQRTRVSLAGPLVNAVLGVILLAATSLVAITTDNLNLLAGLAMLGFLQITATILNLIPMPGLDGYHALEPYLSYDVRRTAQQIAPFGFLILFALLFIPVINRAFFSAIYGIVNLFGVDPGLVGEGWRLFEFWGGLR